MSQPDATTIHEKVKERYSQVVNAFTPGARAQDPFVEAAACCDPADAAALDCCAADYAVDLSDLPEDVTGLSLGCGDPISLAALRPGQTVLDLGSGAGIDVFLAARQVGPTGHVYGVDMTEAMLQKARRNQAKVGLDNVTFRQGTIEDLPLPDGAVDVVISNCVINLSPDKGAVFREAFRVLRSGGRLAVSDMVTLGRFGPAARANMDQWAACVSGAEPVSAYVAWLKAAGFVDISIRDKGAAEVELADTVALDDAPRLFSARITARKP